MKPQKLYCTFSDHVLVVLVVNVSFVDGVIERRAVIRC